MNARNPNGWLPPPRPIYVPPSYDPADSDHMTRWKILLDWAHDDDLKNWLTNEKDIPWEFGNLLTPSSAENFSTDSLIAFYFLGPNPSADDLKAFAETYDFFRYYPVPDRWPAQQASWPDGTTTWIIASYPPLVQNVWNSLDALLTNVVIPKRAALGPLPANQFLDGSGNLTNPIILNYYDDAWIKRVSYPMTLVPQACTAPQWWNLTAGNVGVTIEQWASPTNFWGNRTPLASNDPTGGWYPDGWDFAKGQGAFFDILHAIVAAVSVVLSLTGVGAFVSAFIVAVLTMAVGFAEAASDAISGGNPAGALLNIGSAILSVGTVAAGQLQSLSKPLAKLGQLGLKQLGSLLQTIGTDMTPSHEELNLEQSLALMDQKAAEYGAMDLDRFNAILAVIAGSGGPAVPIAQHGWDTAQYASRDDLLGVGKVYELAFPGAVAALWKLGAQLGTLAKNQGNSLGHALNPYVVSPEVGPKPVALVLSPQANLMNYVRNVLAPRYNIPT